MIQAQGQLRVERFLARAFAKDRLPHALLFVGPEGAGRETMARGLAAAVLCEGEPRPPFGCGACSSCRRVASHNHPDLHLVLSEAEQVARGLGEPEGSRRPSVQIRIDQVRELAHQMRMRPYEGRARVAIVGSAHRMNDNAANALLKTLEEPGPASTIILIAPHERALLPTIASRCARVRFSPLPEETIAAVLRDEGYDDAAERAARAEGSLTLARADPDDEVEGADALLGRLLAASTEERLDAVEAFGRDRQDAERLLAGAERVIARRLRTACESGTEPVRPLLTLLDALDDLREGLEVNAHVQMALEEVFLLRAE